MRILLAGISCESATHSLTRPPYHIWFISIEHYEQERLASLARETETEESATGLRVRRIAKWMAALEVPLELPTRGEGDIAEDFCDGVLLCELVEKLFRVRPRLYHALPFLSLPFLSLPFLSRRCCAASHARGPEVSSPPSPRAPPALTSLLFCSLQVRGGITGVVKKPKSGAQCKHNICLALELLRTKKVRARLLLRGLARSRSGI